VRREVVERGVLLPVRLAVATIDSTVSSSPFVVVTETPVSPTAGSRVGRFATASARTERVSPGRTGRRHRRSSIPRPPAEAVSSM
jgi:hypothetical protein